MQKTKPRDHGQALIEFALIMPVLVLVLLGTMDLGRGVYAYNVVASAAREGARYGITHPNDTSAIQAQALANTQALDPAKLTASVACQFNPMAPDQTDCHTQVNYMIMTVTYQFQPVTAFFATLTLTGKSKMTIE